VQRVGADVEAEQLELDGGTPRPVRQEAERANCSSSAGAAGQAGVGDRQAEAEHRPPQASAGVRSGVCDELAAHAERVKSAEAHEFSAISRLTRASDEVGEQVYGHAGRARPRRTPRPAAPHDDRRRAAALISLT
jgi:hypothetical protein